MFDNPATRPFWQLFGAFSEDRFLHAFLSPFGSLLVLFSLPLAPVCLRAEGAAQRDSPRRGGGDGPLPPYPANCMHGWVRVGIGTGEGSRYLLPK